MFLSLRKAQRQIIPIKNGNEIEIYKIQAGGRKVAEETPTGLLLKNAKSVCWCSTGDIKVKFTSEVMQI